MSTIALFPGTFDPITLGHIDLARRASKLFDQLIVAVSGASGSTKSPLFTADERLNLTRLALKDHPTISVVLYHGLLADFARENHATILIRGIRTLLDYEYERQLAGMNRLLNPALDTLYLDCDPLYASLSSTLIKEVARHGGDVSRFLPPDVLHAVLSKLSTPPTTHTHN